MGGVACPAELLRKQVCNAEPCAVDCKVTEWKQVQRCTNPCGGGIRKERRQVLQPAAHGGMACPKSFKRYLSCNQQPCRGIDCILSEWMDSGVCSKSCGSGFQPQFRRVLQNGRFGGKTCKGHSLHRQISCNLTPCQLQGFDPFAAGMLTGFDFDVAQYCEQPELCQSIGLFELGPTKKPPASSAERSCLTSFACWLLLVNAAM